jgi:hypothetical protein
LSLASPLISTRKDLENFTKFIKSLHKLTELKLEQLEGDESVYSDESETKDESDDDVKKYDFTEMLTRLREM